MRFFFELILLCLTICVISISIAIAPSKTCGYTVHKKVVINNGKSIMSIYLDDLDRTIGGMVFLVSFNADELEFVRLEKSKLTKNVIISQQPGKGKLKFGFLTLAGISKKGKLFDVIFKRKGKKFSSQPRLVKINISDLQGNVCSVH